jgi:hypothetical protein
VSIKHASISNSLQQRSKPQACSLHACTANTGAAADSCKMQHVAQLQLQRGALILEPQLLLQALLQDPNRSHAGATSNATEIPDAAHTQHTTGAATATATPSNSTSTDSAAVILHMAACCVSQDSSSTTNSNCLAATSRLQPPAAKANTSSVLQDQRQQQQQEHDQHATWTNTVTVTISEQQTDQHNKIAAGCPPAVEAWDMATPVLLPAAAAAGRGSSPDAAHDAHVPAGTASGVIRGASSSGEADDDLQDSSSKQLLLVELHLPVASSTAQPADKAYVKSDGVAEAMQQVGKEPAAAGGVVQRWMGRAGMLLLVLAAQVAVYHFATT